MKIKILKGEVIPSDKIKTGDVVNFPPSTALALIKKGIAEEVKESKSEKKTDVTAEVIVPPKKAPKKPRKKKAE